MSLEDYLNTAEGMSGQLIDGAADKVQWAREMATRMLEHANDLEERAESYRHLAAIMIIEAQGYADEISRLVVSEFPTGEDVSDMKNRKETE